MPRLVVIKGPMLGRSFEIKGETAFVGRSLKNDIQIKDGAISRKHLKVFRIGNKYFVEDLRSTNGTMVNGEIITPGEGFEVEDRDTVSIGHTVIRLDGISAGKGLGTKEFESRPARVYSNEEGQVTRERRSRSGKDLELIYNPFSGKVFAKPLFLVGFQRFRNMCSHRTIPIEKAINPYMAIK